MIIVYDEVAYYTPPAYVCAVDYASTSDATGYTKVFLPWWQDEARIKAARFQWLAFTRGNGWSTDRHFPAVGACRPPRTLRRTLIPGLRLARRIKSARPWRHLKTIRRQEKKAMTP